jgi:hypothetical protein
VQDFGAVMDVQPFQAKADAIVKTSAYAEAVKQQTKDVTQWKSRTQ